MFINYIKVALRHLLKYKAFTFITVFGLAAGTTCFILIYMFVQNELSFDSFHENKDNLFRVVMKKEFPASGSSIRGEREYEAFMRPELLEEVLDSNPNIVHGSRYQSSTWNWVEYDEKTRIDAIAYVDDPFLEMFSFQLLVGDSKTALVEPNSTVITEGLATFLFGDCSHDYRELLGKVITLPNSNLKDFTITGIVADPPGISSMQFSILVPYDNWRGMGSSNNDYGRCIFFLELDSKDSTGVIESNISAAFMTAYGDLIKNKRADGQLSQSDSCLSAYLQPLTDMYLNSDILGPYLLFSFKMFPVILSSIAVLILFIACINAVTIQMGQASVRSREVGIRKVVGAQRSQLMVQFFVEAGIIGFVSLVLAILFTELLTPVFNELANFSIGWVNPNSSGLSLDLFSSLDSLLFLFGSLFITTLIIGGFPSLILSSFSPLAIFSFQKPTQVRSLFTSSLVVAQFTITVVLFFYTIVMQHQADFMMDRDLGYQKEGILVLSLPSDFSNRTKPHLKASLQKIPSVLSVAGGDRDFDSGNSNGSSFNQYNELVMIATLKIDEDYLDTLGIPLLEGRNFTESMTTDRKTAVLVNKELVDQFHWENPIGETFRFLGREVNVIGVVDNFYYRSMHEDMRPLCLSMWPNMGNSISYYFVKYNSSSISKTREAIAKAFRKFEPNKPAEIRFLDDIVRRQYIFEQRFNRLNFAASCVAIILSCMGLWGITSIAVARRTKEIGIRKVMGASEGGILQLFSTDIAKLFCVSLFIAVPLGWMTMSFMLDHFWVYHIDLPWPVFIQAGFMCMVIAYSTVGWLVIRAAINNPVKALRYE